MKETLPNNKSLSPRTRETSKRASSGVSLLGLTKNEGDHYRLREGVIGEEESDPLIVVRDGKTDHMAKEGAGRQSSHSTHARERKVPTKSVSSSLTALNQKAQRESKYRFRDLYGLLNLQALYESFASLRKDAAPGVDGVTYEDYQQNLDENLQKLLTRLKCKSYRAPHVKRCFISKAGGKLRPLGLPTLEDKIVQHAASRVLQSIFEADFSEHSYGYRKGKEGAKSVAQKLQEELRHGTYTWVVEADIKGFFDEMDHDWLIKMLEQRIDDKAFIGLISKWLKAEVLHPVSNQVEKPEAGTPQGGIISPILANIYLHFVLDLWIEKEAKQCDGKVIFMRYADDVIVGFSKHRDAHHYMSKLPQRLAKFHLRLAEEKSALVKFSRWDHKGSKKFTFLGFDYYWTESFKRKGYTILKIQTNKKKYRASILAMKEWMKEARSWPLKMILSSLRKKLRGYWNYYGVIGNERMLNRYQRAVFEVIFKWLNRRSQRKSYNWSAFLGHWFGNWLIPQPVTSRWKPEYEQSKMQLAP
jgi:RNA-directed DNA polymerase